MNNKVENIIIKDKDFKKYTIEDRIFLHLLNYNFFRDKYIVSEIITEQGLRKSLNCDLGLISRILKRNEEKGYIFRTLLKIEGKKRKQNTFFLTKEGLEIAVELKRWQLNLNNNINKNNYIQKKVIDFISIGK